MMRTAQPLPRAEIARRLQTTREGLKRAVPRDDLTIEHLGFEADGALVVAGEAVSLAVKKRALRLAAILSNAIGIVDRLHVRTAGQVSDADVRVHLLEMFSLDPRFSDLPAGAGDRAGPGLGVAVESGVVTLTGLVPSLVRQRLAGAVAWRAPGVRDVVNGLGVEPPEADGPDELEEAVREALDGNPLFDDAQVKVGVFGDAVRLTGLVHTADARAAAEEEAWRVLGVDDVINEIELG
jgi:hypothetical protein